MSVNTDLLRQRASDFHEKEQSGRTSRRARSQGASEADGDCTSEAGGSGDESDMEHVTEKHLTLIGREFRDKERKDGEPERSYPLTIKTLFQRFSVIWLCHHLHTIAKTDFAGEGGGYRFLS